MWCRSPRTLPRQVAEGYEARIRYLEEVVSLLLTRSTPIRPQSSAAAASRPLWRSCPNQTFTQRTPAHVSAAALSFRYSTERGLEPLLPAELAESLATSWLQDQLRQCPSHPKHTPSTFVRSSLAATSEPSTLAVRRLGEPTTTPQATSLANRQVGRPDTSLADHQSDGPDTRTTSDCRIRSGLSTLSTAPTLEPPPTVDPVGRPTRSSAPTPEPPPTADPVGLSTRSSAPTPEPPPTADPVGLSTRSFAPTAPPPPPLSTSLQPSPPVHTSNSCPLAILRPTSPLPLFNPAAVLETAKPSLTSVSTILTDRPISSAPIDPPLALISVPSTRSANPLPTTSKVLSPSLFSTGESACSAHPPPSTAPPQTDIFTPEQHHDIINRLAQMKRLLRIDYSLQ